MVMIVKEFDGVLHKQVREHIDEAWGDECMMAVRTLLDKVVEFEKKYADRAVAPSIVIDPDDDAHVDVYLQTWVPLNDSELEHINRSKSLSILTTTIQELQNRLSNAEYAADNFPDVEDAMARHVIGIKTQLYKLQAKRLALSEGSVDISLDEVEQLCSEVRGLQ
jgi:hypothetical protein